ncbi:MAG: RloB domain-containing protein [Candidatus Marinimicrobia bacterium]|nr:RloB domain-containing protein [Candidatus Neomarinimicrobiota bacterium]MBT5528807.1 RloB domain-containing protein [Cytophagia bacterium]
MILTNRFFDRVTPSRTAKSIYIFCEGAKREFNYFKYFVELDSRINLEVYKLQVDEDNSPRGIMSIAENCILKTVENPNPKYNFIIGDEVWIVLDIDEDKYNSREPQIRSIQEKCNELENWNLSLSNPCFEVWLYYHAKDTKPSFSDSEKCVKWKQFVNDIIPGGFDSRKHPIFIKTACNNAMNNYNLVNQIPDIGSTDVYNLANTIIPLIESKLNLALKKL